MVNESCLGGTYLGQVSFMPDLSCPSLSFQCSSVFQPVENVILGRFWVFFCS